MLAPTLNASCMSAARSLPHERAVPNQDAQHPPDTQTLER